jgi:hypothetical protein
MCGTNGCHTISTTSNNAPVYSIDQCLIIKGIPESDDLIPKNRIKHDLSQFQECASKLLQNGEGVEVCKIFRLGSYEPKNFPRPLKVIFRNESQRNILLNRKAMLRSVTPQVFFQREYSPKERQKYRDLYEQLKTRRELGETGLIIRNGEIIKMGTSYLWRTPVLISCPQNTI